jgi:hypothetical protein
MIQKTIDLLRSGWMVILAVVVAGNVVYFSGDDDYYGSFFTGTQKFRSNSQLYGRLTDVLDRFSHQGTGEGEPCKISFHSYHIEGQYFFDVVVQCIDSATVRQKLHELRESVVQDTSIRNYNIEPIQKLKVLRDSLEMHLAVSSESKGDQASEDLRFLLKSQQWNIDRTIYLLGQDFEIFPLEADSLVGSSRSLFNTVVRINLICLVFGLLGAVAYKEIKRR